MGLLSRYSRSHKIRITMWTFFLNHTTHHVRNYSSRNYSSRTKQPERFDFSGNRGTAVFSAASFESADKTDVHVGFAENLARKPNPETPRAARISFSACVAFVGSPDTNSTRQVVQRAFPRRRVVDRYRLPREERQRGVFRMELRRFRLLRLSIVAWFS